MELYQQSKLCNVLFTNELARRYPNKITTYSLHPGLVYTEIARNMSYQKLVNFFMWFIAKTPFQGSQTSIFAALCDKNEIPNGSYLSNCAVKENSNPLTRDLALQKKNCGKLPKTVSIHGKVLLLKPILYLVLLYKYPYKVEEANRNQENLHK